MAINLVKGQRVEIGLTHLKVEMGWKVNPNAMPPYDLDASTFLLGNSGQIENEYDFVFYGSPNTMADSNGNVRPCSLDKSVLGSVDDLGNDGDDTGEGNEEIDIDLTKTSPSINEILFTATIYWSASDEYTFYEEDIHGKKYPNKPRLRYNFGQVQNAFIQIKNAITGEVLCRYDLDEDFSTSKGVEFGRLYRRGSEWKFQAVGESHINGLEAICNKYASKFM